MHFQLQTFERTDYRKPESQFGDGYANEDGFASEKVHRISAQGGGRGVFGEALLEFWGGSTPGTHSLFSWSGGLQARRWQCLGESSFPVVLDFRSCQLLRSALRVGARSGTGSLFTLGAQKEPRTLLALGQLHLTEELEIRAPKAKPPFQTFHGSVQSAPLPRCTGCPGGAGRGPASSKGNTVILTRHFQRLRKTLGGGRSSFGRAINNLGD